MPRSGGQYSLPPVYIATPGTNIRAEQHNIPLEDIAQALTGSLPRDGSAPMAANLPMGGRKITGLGAPTSDTDAARLSDTRVQATVDTIGSVFLANDAQAIAGSALTRVITPASLKAVLDQLVFIPPGAIMPFAGPNQPDGWLICDGGQVSRTTRAALFAAIGTRYGPGNGSTTFNLPDLRGEFVRGWDQGRGIDAGRVLGSTQSNADNRTAEFQTAIDPAGEQGVGTTSISGTGGWSDWRVTGRSPDGNDVHIRFQSNGVTDTRPRNIALLYCIKY